MVYVDPIAEYGTSKTWKWSKSCHMFADTDDELHEFAVSIGLKRSWFQSKKDRDGHGLPHYDLTENKRKIAVKSGAVEVTFSEAYKKWVSMGYVRNIIKE